MAKFRVMYKSTDYVYLDVEADSLEEAKEIAENTDGGEFIEDGAGDWEYDYTEDENGNVIDTLTGLRGDADGDGKVID